MCSARRSGLGAFFAPRDYPHSRQWHKVKAKVARITATAAGRRGRRRLGGRARLLPRVCRGRRGALALGGRRGGRLPPALLAFAFAAGSGSAAAMADRALGGLAAALLFRWPQLLHRNTNSRRLAAGRRRRFANRAGEQLAPGISSVKHLAQACDCARSGKPRSRAASSRTRERAGELSRAAR